MKRAFPQLLLTVALACLSLLAGPSSARALTAVESGEASEFDSISGSGCGSLGYLRVAIPGRATSIEPNFPVGTVLRDIGGTGVVARIVEVKLTHSPAAGKTYVTWVARGSDSTCDPQSFNYQSDWLTDVYTFKADYVTRKAVALPARDVRGYTRRALRRKFGGAYTYAVARRFKCHRTSSISGRCRVLWGIGDSGYRGVVRIWMSVDRGAAPDGTDEVWWNYAMKITRTNEYCVHALKRPLHACQKTIRVR